MKILVGYDGSRASESALDLAQKHATAFKGKICIVTSMKQGPELKKEEIDTAERALKKIKARFIADGIACNTEASVQFQSPGEDIVEYAKENHFDEIIIGVKKKSKVGKLVFGSTAQYIILKADCPVVTVK